MSDDDKKDEAIYKVDTVPPPAGEDDAYSAPTRVGPMAAAVVEEMMVASVRKAAELTAVAEEKAAASKRKAAAEAVERKTTPVASAVAPTDQLSESDLIPDAAPSSRGPSSPRKPPTLSKPPPVPQKPTPPAAIATPLASPVPQGPPPRMYDDADDEDNAATLLSRSAKAPVVAPLPRIPTPPIGFPPAAVSAQPPSRPAPSPPSGPAPPVVSPFAPPSVQPGPLAPRGAPTTSPVDAALLQFPVFVPLAIGFAIFAIGLALYLWAR